MSRQPVMPRVWAGCRISGPNDCWPWLRADCKGYGVIAVNGRQRRVARVIVADKEGVDLLDLSWVARHSCHNPPCCNPAHLSSGTMADNSADMVAAGRSPKASRKLTADELAEVRLAPQFGAMGKDLALMYGVSRATISRAQRGVTYAA